MVRFVLRSVIARIWDGQGNILGYGKLLYGFENLGIHLTSDRHVHIPKRDILGADVDQ